MQKSADACWADKQILYAVAVAGGIQWYGIRLEPSRQPVQPAELLEEVTRDWSWKSGDGTF
ncbi:MAG: hypothetical protein DMG50_25700 [Acidobacteria bacterium]|nr:MAG: hypothetical protein DMG50_25700 [Acidobacteriota bacterium]